MRRDARAFVAAVRERLLALRAERGVPGLVVVAWDTELFGHWWHEGPAFLEAVLRALPAAGVRTASLRTALHGPDAVVDGEVDLADGSWGAGKDFSVWSGPAVRDLADEGCWVQRRLLDVLARERAGGGLADGRRPDLDQLVRQALLVLSSDWAFMVTRDQAAALRARPRGRPPRALPPARRAARGAARTPAAGRAQEARRQRGTDDPFPWLDARPLAARWAG